MVWMGPDNHLQSGPSVIADGLFAATPIATPEGWVSAGDLAAGDLVLTFDHGPQPIEAVYSAPFADAPNSLWPLRVPALALDNRDELILLPEQRLLIENDLAEDLFCDPFALIPAQALEHWRGIARFRPTEQARVIQFRFAEPQILYASRGVLLSCAGEGDWARDDWADPGYSTCTLSQAKQLIACIMAQEAGAALAGLGRHR